MFYPDLDPNLLQNLTLIDSYADAEANYLADSPYPKSLLVYLTKLIAKEAAPSLPRVSNANAALQRKVELYDELIISLGQIKEIREDFSSLTAKEKVAVIAAINTTVTKMSEVLSKLDESINVERFKQIVMQTIEDFLSTEQKEQFLRQLQSTN